MSALEGLNCAGLPILDPEIDRVAYDNTLSLEVRQELLTEMLAFADEFDRCLIESHLATLAMRRMASDRVD